MNSAYKVIKKWTGTRNIFKALDKVKKHWKYVKKWTIMVTELYLSIYNYKKQTQEIPAPINRSDKSNFLYIIPGQIRYL
jgi:hypothetical protein